MPSPFAAVWRALFDAALPAACLECLSPAPAATGLCAACLAPWVAAPPGPVGVLERPDVGLHAAFRYDAASAPLLTRYKFHGDLAAGRALAALALPALARAPRPDALVPVALHRGRLRTRGHDQALGLARDWSRALRLPLRADLLVRQRATRPQTTLDAAERRTNLADAFQAKGPCPAHVALVDDVATTGSTLAAAAEALRRAGAARIDAWVVARVPAGDQGARAR